jgi:hypothetical protein
MPFVGTRELAVDAVEVELEVELCLSVGRAVGRATKEVGFVLLLGTEVDGEVVAWVVEVSSTFARRASSLVKSSRGRSSLISGANRIQYSEVRTGLGLWTALAFFGAGPTPDSLLDDAGITLRVVRWQDGGGLSSYTFVSKGCNARNEADRRAALESPQSESGCCSLPV